MFPRKHKAADIDPEGSARTEAMKMNAEFELNEALTIAQQLREIREANHFTEGFRKVIGVSRGT